MSEIDVTKVTAIEYLEKYIKISKEEICGCACNVCKYNSISCVTTKKIADMGVANHIKGVMTFELSETETDWTKVEKDTLIEVRDFDTDDWIKRYFSHYYNGQVLAYINGCTSKTEIGIAPWAQARLIEDDND